MKYALLHRTDWDGRQAVVDSPGAILVHASRLAAHVQEQTGRSSVLTVASCARKLRENGRLYVAANRKDHPKGGLLIEAVPLPATTLTRTY